MKHIQRAILCLALISGSALGGPFEAGLSALDREHYATAMRAWLKLANEGAAEAQNNIGHLYEQGFGVSQNYTEAMNWYRKAADQGLAEAQHNMGMLYYHGYGVAENQRTAASWFKRAALQDLVDAEYMLGLAYHEGKGVELNYQLAKHWFKKAALKAYGNAQFMYAFMLQAGAAGKSKPFEALIWSEVARLNGQPSTSDIADIAKLKLEDEQIGEAEKLALRCVESGYADCP
ncbi:MAG: sel1 repeat family protein [Porticoccaceae bacterium]|jgi:TPR repeat protein|nr:sel1 repeat family protein [Porticoccaceae bacterium]MBT6115677.1 sel1 repeat family protein [Porticoccaceae bacterium]MBT6592662.1 sel1 repeat family protein [Porticoccaceae bacterium]MDG1078792.1 tetratricopeptide repeat protein [Porticoccaceae bacterium]MDG1495932.1 tetratricopeptide repeat protein [Porticoccaceae bacterium]